MSLPSEQVIVPLQKRHNRDAFSCGKPAIDKYLKEQVSQDIKRKTAVAFVLEGNSNTEIAGFYVLSSFSIHAGELPKVVAKKMPTKIPIPCTLLGQFAIDETLKNQGIGGWLLAHVLNEVLLASTKIASFALVVDAIDEEARAFWIHCGFISFPNTPGRLFLPIKTIKKLFM